MVLVYTSVIGPFKYCVAEWKKESDLLKTSLSGNTIVASPMLHEEKLIFIIQDSELSFDWKRNDTVEELTSVMLEEFKKSHLPKFDVFTLRNLLEHGSLKALRNSDDKDRLEFIENEKTKNAMLGTRRTALFGKDEKGDLKLLNYTPISKHSTPLRVAEKKSEKTNENIAISSNLSFGNCQISTQKSHTSVKLVDNKYIRTMTLRDEIVNSIKSERMPDLENSTCASRKRMVEKDLSQRQDSSQIQSNTFVNNIKRSRLITAGPKILQNIVENVENLMKEQVMDLNSVELAAKLTGVSPRTIYRNNTSIRKPKMKLNSSKKQKEQRAADSITVEHKKLLRIQLDKWWHDESNVTVKKVCEWFSKELGVSCGEFKTRQILRGMGLTYKKKSRNSIIEERPDLVRWRHRFLTKKMELKRSTIPILYAFQDETWIYSGMTSKNGWQYKFGSRYDMAVNCGFNTSCSGPPKGKERGVRAIVLSVITQLGILKDSTRVVISGVPETQQTEDYHSQMDTSSFMKYMKLVIKNLSEFAKEKKMKAALFLDNASYHSKLRFKAPTKQSKKDELLAFLQKYSAEITDVFHNKMSNAKLLEICNKYVESKGGAFQFRVYELDAWALENYNVEIVRLPPYHAHFNPIELMWAQLKGHLKSNCKTTSKITEVRDLALKFFDGFDAIKCAKLIGHVEKVEQQHRYFLGIR